MKPTTQNLAAIVLLFSLGAQAQAQVTRGFDRQIPATALNVEVIRQPTLQVMELQIKPVRLVWVDLPNTETGEVEKTQVWYLVWRAINRPVRKRTADDKLAVNRPDPLPGPLQFMPSFTLVNYDDPANEENYSQILPDRILPQAIREIEKIERIKLNNTVTAIQDFPPPVDPEAEDQPWIYGVATWAAVDPKTDFFKIIMQGFSNGYENRGTVEDPKLWRKVVVQRFYRPGDEFDPNIKEFEFRGQPEWTYQPDSGPIDATQPTGLQ